MDIMTEVRRPKRTLTEEGDRYIMDNKLELSLLKRRGAKAMGSVCVHFESHGLCAVAFSGNVATQHE